jgi:hypothetical protein
MVPGTERLPMLGVSWQKLQEAWAMGPPLGPARPGVFSTVMMPWLKSFWPRAMEACWVLVELFQALKRDMEPALKAAPVGSLPRESLMPG